MKYEDIIKHIERIIEKVVDKHIDINGGPGWQGYLNCYEVEEALNNIYDKEIFKFDTTRIGNITLLNIDSLLLEIDFERGTNTTVEELKQVSYRRAEKILYSLENNFKKVEIEEVENNV